MTVDTDLSDLVERARSGHEEAWEQLVDRYSGLVVAITRSFRLSSDDAADIAQTTWLRLFESIERIRQPLALGAWIATTARRECLRIVRTGGREVPSEDLDRGEVARAFAVPDSEVLRAEERTTVRAAVCDLPDRHRDLLSAMLVAPSPSYATIADTLDMPIGSIGPTRVRALERLRRDPQILALAG